MLENRFTAHEGNKHQERSLGDDKFRDDDFFNTSFSVSDTRPLNRRHLTHRIPID